MHELNSFRIKMFKKALNNLSVKTIEKQKKDIKMKLKKLKLKNQATVSLSSLCPSFSNLGQRPWSSHKVDF